MPGPLSLHAQMYFWLLLVSAERQATAGNMSVFAGHQDPCLKIPDLDFI